VALALLQRHPRTVGAYDLMNCLGRGGVGSVYKARRRDTGQIVAVKILATQFAKNPSHQKRFEQEFRVAHDLDHPNIARAIDFGEDNNAAYIVMEFVEGESLGDHIEREGAMDETAAVRVITHVAQALHLAHQRGLIHRDIKPDNILLRLDGLVKVTDFGLVKNLGDDQNLTRVAVGMGTPHFMAPEQYEDAKNASIRCDVYSLGATLYNAVTGQMPFGACNTMKELLKKVDGDIPSPRQLAPNLSQQVDWAIRRAMSPLPEHRPASCLDFVQDLIGKNGRRTPLGLIDNDHLAAFVPNAPGGKERRAAVRYPFTQGALCTLNPSVQGEGPDDDVWPAIVQNLSRGGLGLLLARRFEPGTVLTIELHGGREGSRWTKILRVARVQLQEYGHWLHGCTFLDPLTTDQLQDLL
jgi:serine/threonine protein kinase